MSDFFENNSGVGSRTGLSKNSVGVFKPRPRPPKLYRIGELVEYCGMSRQTIHNYTTMGLLRETRWTHGGHRLYGEQAFDRLDKIAQMRADNRTIEYIRKYFSRLDARLVNSESLATGREARAKEN